MLARLKHFLEDVHFFTNARLSSSLGWPVRSLLAQLYRVHDSKQEQTRCDPANSARIRKRRDCCNCDSLRLDRCVEFSRMPFVTDVRVENEFETMAGVDHTHAHTQWEDTLVGGSVSTVAFGIGLMHKTGSLPLGCDWMVGKLHTELDRYWIGHGNSRNMR